MWDDLERARVDVGEKVLAVLGKLAAEEPVIEPHLAVDRVRGGDPVKRRLRPSPVGRIAAPGRGIVGAANFGDLARIVLHDAGAGDEVGRAKPHFASRREPKELLRRFFHEVVPLDPELARERHLAPSRGRIFGIVRRLEPLGLGRRIVLDHDLEWAENTHHAVRGLVEVVANAVLEKREVDHVLALGDADTFGEGADRFGGVAAPAVGRDGRHARIVPAIDVPLLHEPEQLPLRHHRVVEIEARELDLPRL